MAETTTVANEVSGVVAPSGLTEHPDQTSKRTQHGRSDPDESGTTDLVPGAVVAVAIEMKDL